jgi:hypothetical protein
MELERFITSAEVSALKAFILGAMLVYFVRHLKPEKPKCKEIKNIKLRETKDLP